MSWYLWDIHQMSNLSHFIEEYHLPCRSIGPPAQCIGQTSSWCLADVASYDQVSRGRPADVGSNKRRLHDICQAPYAFARANRDIYLICFILFSTPLPLPQFALWVADIYFHTHQAHRLHDLVWSKIRRVELHASCSWNACEQRNYLISVIWLLF